MAAYNGALDPGGAGGVGTADPSLDPTLQRKKPLGAAGPLGPLDGTAPTSQPFTGTPDVTQMAPAGGAQFLPGGIQPMAAPTQTPAPYQPPPGQLDTRPGGMTSFGGDAGLPGVSPQSVGSASPPTSAAGASTFGPGSNLIGTQFSPTADPRLATTQGQVSGLQGQVAAGGGQIPGAQQAQGLLNQATGLTTGQRLDPTTGLLNQAQQQIGQAQLGPLQGLGSDVGQARQQTLGALGALTSAPNRQQLAQQLYDTFDKQSTAQTGQAIRDLGERAAALGRTGSGMVTSEAGDIFGQRDANLANIRAQLASQTGGQVEGDLLNRLSAAQGVTQGLGGLDLSQSGLGLQAGQAGANLALGRGSALAGLGGQQFGQQQAQAGLGLAQAGQLGSLAGEQFGMGQGQLGAQQGVLGQLAGLEGQQYGQNMGNLGFLQGERGYQQGLDQQALQNQVQQFGLEQGAQQQQFGQEQDVNAMLANLGFGGNTSDILSQLAGTYGQQGSTLQAGAGDILRQLFGQPQMAASTG